MAATPTIMGQTGHGLDRPTTFVRAMQNMKRKQHGMSDRFEMAACAARCASWPPADLAISASVTETG
jgi:hypothetical protein